MPPAATGRPVRCPAMPSSLTTTRRGRRSSVAAVLLCLLLFAAVACSSSGSSDSNGASAAPETTEAPTGSLRPLHATRGDDARVLDDQGRQVLLRGVNLNVLGDYYQAN